MDSKRHNYRARCDSHCQIMGIDGVTYHVKLDDLSLNGALVEMNETQAHSLHIGEMCGLKLTDTSTSSTMKHTGMIVRLDSGFVGINFNRQEHLHQKKKFVAPS